MSSKNIILVRRLAALGLMVGVLWGLCLISPGDRLALDQQQRASASGLDTNLVYLPIIRKPAIPSQFGVDMGAITAQRGLDELTQAQNYWLRRGGLLWLDVEPDQGDRLWNVLADLETEMINASQAGMPMLAVIAGTPDWARALPAYSCGPIRPEALGAFASFMHDLVARYSAPPYNVKYWEIWNEPDASPSQTAEENGFGCWGDENDPYYGGRAFGEMLRVVTPLIKAADPEAQVLVGGLLLDCDPNNPPPGKNCDQAKFLEGILVAGGKPYFDGVSFHAYDYYYAALGDYRNPNWNSAWNTTGPVALAKSQYLKNLLASYGAGGKYLMNTEAALLCDDTENSPYCDPDPGSDFEQSKAYYVAHSYALAVAEGFKANIWYSLYGWRNSGLFYTASEPRPAFAAFSFARQILGTGSFVRRITEYPGVTGYEFYQAGKTIWLLWSLDGATHQIALPATPQVAYDVFGEVISVPGASLQVTLAPVYLTW